MRIEKREVRSEKREKRRKKKNSTLRSVTK
jgi:hypothetical protein